MSRATLTEARAAAKATAVEGQMGRFRIELITPGWGSSGYYSREVLEAAGKAQIFPAGTHMYLDHPTVDRPERSVRDLAAVLSETALWDPAAGEDQTGALVAEVAVFGPYREVLTQMKDAIGASVRAVAEVVENGTAEGRRGRIVTELVEGKSVDFVTHAGRGGRIVEILESARTVEEKRSIGQWIESRLHRDFTITADDMAGDGRLTREERISLSSAIGDALTSFVGRLEADQPQLYARDLWEDPQDTVATALEAAKNVTATRPDSNTPATKSKENPMGKIEVDEAEHRQITEKAGRVDTLESERDTEKQRADAAEAKVTALEAEKATAARATRAAEIVKEAATAAKVTFTALESKGLTADLPVDDKGALDEAAFTKSVDEAAKAKAEEAGAGRPRGFGHRDSAAESTVTESDVDAMLKRRAGIVQNGA